MSKLDKTHKIKISLAQKDQHFPTSHEEKQKGKRKAEFLDNIIDNKDKVMPNFKRTKLNNVFEMICNSPKSINEDQINSFLSEFYPSQLEPEHYTSQDCGSSGDCLFQSISFLLNGEISHQNLREMACNYIKRNEMRFQHCGNIKKHLKSMKLAKTWGTHFEIDALANELGRVIILYKKTTSLKQVKTTFSKHCVIGPLFISKEVLERPPIMLEYFPEWHYQALDQNQSIQDKLWLLPSIKEEIPSNPKPQAKKRIKNKDETKCEKQTKIKENNQSFLDKKIEEALQEPEMITISNKKLEIFDKVKEDDLEKRNNRTCPIKSRKNDLYNDCLAFFKCPDFVPESLKGEGKTGRKWQDKRNRWRQYIKKNFEYDKDKDRIKQLSEKSLHNIPCKGQKAIIQELQQKNKTFGLSDDSLKFQWYYYIPFEDEKQKLLGIAHNHILHIGIERMMTAVYQMNFNWNGIVNDVKKYVNSCALCKFKNSRMPKQTRPIQQIVATCPREIYQIDEVLLALNLQQSGFKYLITIADHFSKFFWCTAVPTKEAKYVKEALLTFFALRGKPKCLQSDNGLEFKNNLIEGFLKSIDVEFKHGRPYHPQSQGMIESLNRRVQQALKIHYNKSPETYDLQLGLHLFMEQYNNEFHFTIKETPNKAFYLDPKNPQDNYLLQRIKTKQIQSFKRKLMSNDFIVEQKVLIYNFVEKKSGSLKQPTKKPKKQALVEGYFIPGIVTQVHKTQIGVRISKSSQIISTFINEGEVFKVDINLVKMISEHDWEEIIQNQF